MIYFNLNLVLLGVYPPTDRMSILTCKSLCYYGRYSVNLCLDWWGLELLLPSPSLAYLGVCDLHDLNTIGFLTFTFRLPSL